MADTIQTNLENGVLSVELTRPEKKNALTEEMYRALNDVFEAASGDDRTRIVLLTGSRDCFCAGNDLANFKMSRRSDSEDPGLEFVKNIMTFEKPIVAAVNGPAIGLGATLLLHCDLVYASSNSFFQLPFVDLGICPEAGSTFLLPRSIGYVRAAALLLLGERCDARQWLNFGLLTEVVDSRDCREYAMKKARELAEKPFNALMVTRQLLRDGNGKCNEVAKKETACMRKLLLPRDLQ